MDETQHKLAAILSVFCENAAGDAARVATHRGDPCATTHDVVRALKLQALPSSGFFAHPDLASRAQGHYNALTNSSTRGGAHSHPTYPSIVPVDELVRRMRDADAEFDAWAPDTPETRTVKRAIERTATEFLGDLP